MWIKIINKVNEISIKIINKKENDEYVRIKRM
jgi:hypothetical protein